MQVVQCDEQGSADGERAVPNRPAAKAIGRVHHEATVANMGATGGHTVAQRQASRPVMVARSVNGATMRFAGMDQRGTCGLMRICTGRVNTCALTVIASACAAPRGIHRAHHAWMRGIIMAMPHTAEHDRAKPKFAARVGSVNNANMVVQHSACIVWHGRLHSA